MKRKGYIYEKIYNIENLKKASLKAQKGKKWYKEIQDFNDNSQELINELKLSLTNKTYKTSEYEIFEKVCGKKQEKYTNCHFTRIEFANGPLCYKLRMFLLKGLQKTHIQQYQKEEYTKR